MKKIILLCFCLFSQSLIAKETANIFVKHEFNDTDNITGLGISYLAQKFNSNFLGEGLTSISNVKVLDNFGEFQEYIAWDVGLRMGYYNDIFLYIEAGLDVLELTVRDLKNDDDYFYDDEDGNGIDGYAALGGGFLTDRVRLELFIKARKIDGDYWESEHQIFYGAQFSLTF